LHIYQLSYFNLDKLEVAFETSGIIAFIVIFLLSKRAENYVAAKTIGGYWKYSINTANNNKAIDQNSERVAKIAFDGESLTIRGWESGRPRQSLFAATEIFFSDLKNKSGSLVYEYRALGDSMNKNNYFEGYVFLDYHLENDKQSIDRLNGRYVSKFPVPGSKQPDMGMIVYERITEEDKFARFRCVCRCDSSGKFSMSGVVRSLGWRST
jgi:hypothetical protein